MAIKTVNLLPEIFRSDSNKKFLNATLDQLVSEPDLRKINGYVGRKFAPTYQANDNYQPEPSAQRQNYQLEPSIIVKNTSNNLEFFSSYQDLLQQIQYYGGITTDHSRLFSNQSYTFDGKFDFDKIVNFNQYYWLENGPDAVEVFSDQLDKFRTFKVTRDPSTNSYKFDGFGSVENPELRLAYGGTYQFIVNQPGYPFYIQSDPGVSGTRPNQPSLSSRNVLGVSNNGVDIGVVTFTVPQISAQDVFLNMPLAGTADLSTTLSYSDVQFISVENLISRYGGFDGVTTSLQGKTLVFVNTDLDDQLWTGPELFDADPAIQPNEAYAQSEIGTVLTNAFVGDTKIYIDNTALNAGMYVTKEVALNPLIRIKSILGNEITLSAPLNVNLSAGDVLTFNYTNYDAGATVPESQRRSVWRITVQNIGNVPTIRLTPDVQILKNQRVFVRGGKLNGEKTYYRESITDLLKEVPQITAPLPTLYYQDGVDERFQGQILVSELSGKDIIINNIIGKTTYISPNGVEFTNGLKVRFRSGVQPSSYAEKEYYVEGVGKSIRLLLVDNFVSPEGFGKNPDYITINRASRDLNPWTRSNRWFHANVLEKTAQYNSNIVLLDQKARANRPIIEFDPDLQLFNFGREAKDPVDLLILCDNSYTDAFNQIELQEIVKLPHNVKLVEGDRVIFGKDIDDRIRNKVYKVVYFYKNNKYQISLQESDDYAIAEGNNLISRKGVITDNFPAWSAEKDYYKGEKVIFVDSSTVFNIYEASKNILRGQLDPLNNSDWLNVYSEWLNSIPYATGDKVVYGTYQSSNVFQATTTISVGAAAPDVNANWTNLGSPNTGEIVMGVEYYFDGNEWQRSQDKTSLNQFPLFDVVDSNGVSLADTNKYPINGIEPKSRFSGTKVFSYEIGIGENDSVLGFPLSYRNFNQIGDIKFNNNFDSDFFTYYDSDTSLAVKQLINSVGFIKINDSLNSYHLANMWLKESEVSQQFQILSYTFDGTNRYFQVDITPFESDSTVPHFRVFKNGQKLSTEYYERIDIGVGKYVNVTDPNLISGDRIDIKIYSKQVSSLGYYEIPKNLDFNTQNELFYDLTLGQLRNHLDYVANNTTKIIGTVPGPSNLRDIDVKAQGGSILQHTSPLLYSMLFLVDEKINFMKAIELARHEYNKIKNKFLELSQSLKDVNENDIPYSCDLILKNINQVKNKNFPWYYSDMVPYGDVKNTITRYVLDAEIRDYEISAIFDDETLSNKAVLVYLNNVQLIKGSDYAFNKNSASVSIFNSVILTVGDELRFVEYSNTDGNYIPETPTKLGLYPRYTPSKYLDNTYQTPINVIRGHDGSITPAFGDFRDDLLLEFEKRIYNNIKIDYQKNKPTIFDFIPGKFRKVSYSLNEFNRLLTKSFLKWAGANRIDFTTNLYFEPNNPFTWNYSRFGDSIDQEKLAGTWRAIFKYFYDTDQPNVAPWEMLGFSEQPDWWEDRYGPAPYTGGNKVLWQDCQNGYIHAGPRAGIDPRFVRPGLLDIIPVDDRGLLRPPSEFAVLFINSNDTNISYAIGEQGPAETAWRRSSDFPFAMQQALALGYPAYYFGSQINVNSYTYNSELDQFLRASDLRRITPTTVDLNGEIINSTVVRTAGYINWIEDYLRSNGIDPITKIRGYLDSLTVQLSYKMAGFSDPTMIQVIAEQGSPSSQNLGVIVPQEDYVMPVFKSTPTRTVTYSAVIIEKSENGYTVSGYDLDSPYFTIIPSIANNNAYAITALNDRAVIYQDYQNYKVNIPYGFEFLNKQQVVDFLISYERYLIGIGLLFDSFDSDLGEQRNFALSAKEFLTWSQQGWQTGNVLVLSPILNQIKVQATVGVVDKIENTPDSSRLLDTNFSFIKSSQFTIVREDTTFKLTTNFVQTIGLAKLSVVDYENVLIFNNQTVFNDIIYLPNLGNRQYRLKLIGYKTGNWNGSLTPGGFVYNNENIPQWQAGVDYKKGSLVLYKSFIYVAIFDIIAAENFEFTSWRQVTRNEIKTGLLPNFTYNSAKFNQFFDLDNPSSEGSFDDYSNRLIGFQERQYMTDFGINKSVQAKFYQGFIKEKGTINAVNAFTAAGFNNVSSTVNMYEEWGLRIGEYGATNNNKFIEVTLVEGRFTGDPITFTLLSNNQVAPDQIIGVYPTQLYRSGIDYQANIYLNRDNKSIYENDIHSAGYVSLNDVDGTIFDLGNYANLYTQLPNMGVGFKLWCAKDFSDDWNVFRLSETDSSVIEITYAIDNICTVTTNRQNSLSYGDLIVIKGFDTRLDGIFQVYAVINPFKFNIVAAPIIEQIKQLQTVSGIGPLYKFISVRVKNELDLNQIQPSRGWLDGDKLWIDTDRDTNDWAVYNKSTPWTGNVSDFNPNMKMYANNYVTDSGFGTVTSISKSGKLAAAGMPSFTDALGVSMPGNVIVFTSNVTNGNILTQIANISPTAQGVSKFGSSLDFANDYLYIGAPGNGSTESGNVYIYQCNSSAGTTSFSQRISSYWLSNVGDAFGQSLTISEDGRWLFVGAPNKGNVEVYYSADIGTSYTYANTISGSSANKFGYRVKTTTDASQTIISAPYETINGITSAGAVYVYDRSVETFITATSNTFVTFNTINSNTLRVLLKGNLQILNSDYTVAGNLKAIIFADTPIIGSRVDIETNKFELLQKLTPKYLTSGGEFGISSHISGNDSEIFIASPGFSEAGYHSGIVYRYVDRGAVYGEISGTNLNANVSIGDSLRINGQLVTMTGTTYANVVTDINSANIPGISAAVSDFGKLTITSNITVPYQKLILGPAAGSILSNIGINTYDYVQEIRHPVSQFVDQFGSQLLSTPDARQLVVGAYGGTTYNTVRFDAGKTTFDFNSTSWLDAIAGSGAVYIYGLVGGDLAGNIADQYVLVQNLENRNLKPNDMFGTGLAMNGNTLLVGARNDGGNRIISDAESGLLVEVPRTGTYYVYNNFSSNIGWDVLTSAQPKVDINSIGTAYIFDSVTNQLITRLDYIDPAKGRILGTAAQDIDFRTPYDPAVYNVAGTIEEADLGVSFSTDFHWGSSQVGKIWWNLDAIRFLDYEQGSLIYRSTNWGSVFPGSEVEVYEWVQSDFVPSQYAGSGVPRYPDNTAYVVETYVDSVTNIVRSRYYFWVRNKTTINVNSPKTNSVDRLEQLIANPEIQGIPYIQVVRSDTISLHGVTDKIVSNAAVLHLNYDTLKNTNIVHSEFSLIQEGSEDLIVPTTIIDKIKDSLAGVNEFNQPVPEPSLAFQNRIGISNRPRQTVFINRLKALENYIRYVNDILIQHPVMEQFNVLKLYSGEPLPSIEDYDLAVDTKIELDYLDTTKFSNGYVVLVKNDESARNVWSVYEYTNSKWVLSKSQSYNVAFYWEKTDWYDSSYDPTTKPDYVVENFNDLLKFANLPDNTEIKVLNNGRGQFEVYRFIDNKKNLVGLQNGTLQFLPTLYDPNVNCQTEIRIIFDAILQDIFVNSLKQNFNELFFYLINYILTEQKNVEWLFKTSFISVLHELRKLQQFATYIRDNQTYYESYINEVKPYRTSIREYKVSYEGDDQYDSDLTDFDLPSIYVSEIEKYHSPDGSEAVDSDLLANSSVYSQWYTNHTYSIKEVIVTNPGIGLQDNIYSLLLKSNLSVEAGDTISQSQLSGVVEGTVISASTGNLVTISNVDVGSTFNTTNYIFKNAANTNILLSGFTVLSNSGYYLAPNVSVVGGGGQGANVRAIIDFDTNTIAEFQVLNGGYGYTSTPTIQINGVGINAAGYPLLAGQFYEDKISAQNLTLEKPVTVYAGNLIIQPNNDASGTVYRSSSGNTITLVNLVGTFTSNDYIFTESANLQVRAAAPTNILILSGNANVFIGNIITTTTGQATVFANATGSKNIDFDAWETRVLVWNLSGEFYSNVNAFRDGTNLGVAVIHNIPTSITSPLYQYYETVNKSYNKIRTFNSKLKFDRINYDTVVINWQPNLTVSANTIVSYQGKGYLAKETVYSSAIIKLESNISVTAGDFVTQENQTGNATVSLSSSGNLVTISNISGSFYPRSGNILLNATTTNVRPLRITNVFDQTKYQVVEAGEFTNANDRIWAYYQPTQTMLAKDLKKLIPGIEYPGVKIEGVKFDESTITLNTNLVHTGTFITSLGLEVPYLTNLVSANVSLLNFLDLGFQANRPLTIRNHDVETITLSGPVLVSAGDYIIQGAANVKVLKDSASNVVVVQSNGLSTTAGNVTTLNYHKFHGNINFSGLITANVGNVFIQPDTAATAVVNLATFSSNTVSVISISGTFRPNSYIYLEAANTNTYFTGIDYDTYSVPTIFSPVSILENSQKTYVQNLDAGNLYVNRLTDVIPIGANLTLEYYDYDNPLYLDTIIESSYGTKRYELILDGYLSAPAGTVLGQKNGNISAVFSTTLSNVDRFTISSVQGVFDSTKNLTLDGFDTGVKPVTISVLEDTQSSLGVKSEDINIDGGAYYDTFSSHAPEELIPGKLSDSLILNVYTKIYANTSNVGCRIIHGMNANVMSTNQEKWPQYYKIANVTTRLFANLDIIDSNIFVEDASLLAAPDPLLAKPGIVYINGELISYYERDLVQNRLGRIRRSVNGTGAPSLHANLSTVEDSSLGRLIPFNSHSSTWLNITATQTLPVSGNLIINVGNVVSQAVSGATGNVYSNSSGNVITLINSSGVFNTTNYLFGNVSANLQVIPTQALNIFDGTGLAGSTSNVALFIKGELI